MTFSHKTHSLIFEKKDFVIEQAYTVEILHKHVRPQYSDRYKSRLFNYSIVKLEDRLSVACLIASDLL